MEEQHSGGSIKSDRPNEEAIVVIDDVERHVTIQLIHVANSVVVQVSNCIVLGYAYYPERLWCGTLVIETKTGWRQWSQAVEREVVHGRR